MIDFFIVGAPKAGTDSVRQWINECVDVHVYGPKEPNYFCADLLRAPKEIEPWVRRVVRSGKGKAIIGEKSTWYLASKTAPEMIKAFNPEARIIVMVRDHVELFESLHGELVKLGVEFETDPIQAWLDTLRDPHRLSFDNTAITDYPNSCLIGRQIERWIDVFGHNQVLIMEIHDLKMQEGRARLARFLGIATFPKHEATILNARHATPGEWRIRGSILSTVRGLLGALKRNVFSIFKKKDLLHNRALPARITPRLDEILREQVKIEIRMHFKEDQTRLEALILRNTRHHDS